jgi:predicted aspartyl protease
VPAGKAKLDLLQVPYFFSMEVETGFSSYLVIIQPEVKNEASNARLSTFSLLSLTLFDKQDGQ